MNKIKLYVKSSDNEYAGRLKEYIKINGLNMFILTEDNADVVLEDSGAENELLLKTSSKEWHTGKYQSADKIISAIMENIDISAGINVKSERVRHSFHKLCQYIYPETAGRYCISILTDYA
jgi:hypothetical protein